MVVFASYVAFSRYIEGEEVVAPDVHSRTVVDALVLLKNAKLSLILDRREPNETLGEGRIVSQHPRPGLRVKAGASVHVVVSSGSRHVEIPEALLGMNRLQAGIQLRDLGLQPGAAAYLPTRGQGNDVVLALDPPAGTGMPPGSPVNLLVSVDTSGETLAMPNLYGLSPGRAREELLRYGLTLGETYVLNGPAVAPGTIHTQEPAAGTAVNEQSRISIYVAPVD